MSKKTKPIPIDESKIDLEKLRDKVADLPALMEYAHSVGGFAIVPTDAGMIKSRAMNAMQEQTTDQLQLIYEQMQTLAGQAKKLKDRVNISEQVYEAKMNFEPCIGQSYYLYQKEDGSKTLSLISPEEWKNTSLQALAKVKLLSDHTWKILENYKNL